MNMVWWTHLAVIQSSREESCPVVP